MGGDWPKHGYGKAGYQLFAFDGTDPEAAKDVAKLPAWVHSIGCESKSGNYAGARPTALHTTATLDPLSIARIDSTGLPGPFCGGQAKCEFVGASETNSSFLVRH